MAEFQAEDKEKWRKEKFQEAEEGRFRVEKSMVWVGGLFGGAKMLM